jgi:NAD(P)-dependent dehydrogenase (short-subunit alcohol dehydrogenase family)
MTTLDLAGKAVLVTGGTRGLGKAIAQSFTRTGAVVFVTHRWASVPDDELAREFEGEGLAAPHLIQCDASDLEETRAMMTVIHERVGSLHAVVSNVAFAQIARGVRDLRRATLELSLGYSAWPILYLVQTSHEVFGVYPRYVIGISSDGGVVCHEGYDLAGVSKSALETLCRYLALRLKPHGVRVNALRPGLLDTASLHATFGETLVDDIKARMPDLVLSTRPIADACVGLCSGLMDAVTGQVIVADEGSSLVGLLGHALRREPEGAERGGP